MTITTLPDGLTVGRRIHLDRDPAQLLPTAWFRKPGDSRRWRVLATDGIFTLYQNDVDEFVSGCFGPLNRGQALAHWGNPSRTDERTRRFVAALRQLPSDTLVRALAAPPNLTLTSGNADAAPIIRPAHP